MPAARTIQHSYETAPRRLLALLSDPDYLRRRCIEDGDRDIRIEVLEVAEGLRIRVERDHTVELPSFVRGLLKPTNRTTELYTWRRDDLGFVADYEVTARGMPGTVIGSLHVHGDESTARLEASFQVEARLPLIASMLENLMANGFAEHLQRGAEHLERTLRGVSREGESVTFDDGLRASHSG